jgi:hypothetical protein
MNLDGLFSLVAIGIGLLVFIILAVVAVIVVVAFRKGFKDQGGVGAVFAKAGRAIEAGTESALQQEVERIGLVGEATVLDCNDLETVAKNRTMIYHDASLVLEVRLPNVAPYRAPCRQWFISSKWSTVSEGSVVPVRVDPRNAQVVFVDLAARERAKEAAEAAERDRHARRQAELLGQNNRH